MRQALASLRLADRRILLATEREQSRASPYGLASWTLDGSRAVAIIRLQGEEANPEPDPEGTFLLGAQGDILIGLQHGVQIIQDGEHTGAKPGRFVRGPGWKKMQKKF